MAKRKALGKGLSALIPDAATEPSGDKGSLFAVDISDISPNRFQPRHGFDDAGLDDLARSIAEKGVIQPLIVREVDDGYELIAGERRLRASKLAGLAEVPVVIKDVSDAESLEIALIENIQREDLNPLEESEAYQRLIDEFDITQEEMAKRVGKDRTTITNSLRLLSLPDTIKRYLATGELTTGHARALLSLGDTSLMLATAKRIITQGLSVRATEALVKRLKEGAPPSEKPARDAHYDDLEESLTRSLGTKVRLTPRGEGGKIEIEYYSPDELDRLLELLGG
ncbi:MAG: ParB/RepB/Spo0J family partition protein [Deltaproteobacteria bacterium]|nr:ParB/RepB/Spo0J family partition protein [Candidatus Zymogenaceae bacterium]